MEPAVDSVVETSPSPTGSRRALLILNGKARNGGADIEGALAILRAAGFAIEPGTCDSAGGMAGLVRERARECDCVVVGGGDGTLNCVAPALLDCGLPLGILPLGTANDLARTLGISFDPVVAARTIVDGMTRDIDLGEVNGHVFFNVASIGFSAELARELTAEAKKRWGTLGYALASARLLVRSRRFTAFIEHDGTTEKVNTVQISVGNGRHYGGGLTVDESAQPDDGKLHVYSLEVDHWWKLIALAPALRRGTLGAKADVRSFATNAVTVRTRRARSVNTDGELSTATPAVFRLIPKAVKVYAPATPLPRA